MSEPARGLTELNYLPAGLLERPASSLHQVLDGPTLIHLPGRTESAPLFVSVLQHGNEVTGWEAVRRLLKSRYLDEPLPCPLSLFIGNVQAARHRLRRLDDQLDFNRCWPGGDLSDSPTGQVMQRVTDRMRELAPYASVDIHNNTGLNPHYAAINRIRSDFLRLASRFSYKVIYFTMPRGTQADAFASFCPAVTLECGLAGEVHGTDHSMGYLEGCLQLDTIDTRPVDAESLHLFRTVATVTIPDDVLFGFGDVPVDLSFPEQLDALNFVELPVGTPVGRVADGVARPVHAADTRGDDVTEQYFEIRDGRLRTRAEVMPSMLTMDRRVIQQDCLCYLMERIRFEDHVETGDAEPLPEAFERSDRPGERSRDVREV